MNTKTITLVALMMAVVPSCTKDPRFQENPDMDRSTLFMDFSPAQTRVYVDGARTLPQKGDAFSVFYRSSVNERWTYDGQDGTTDGRLSPDSEPAQSSGSGEIYAIYPWHAQATVSDGVISTEIPQTQYFTRNSFGRGAAVLSARSTSDTLHFHYATGFVCLSVSGKAKVQNIELHSTGGEKMSGAGSLDINGDIPVLNATEASSVLLRNLDFSPIVIDGTTDFIFSIAPGTYQDGVSFIITYTTGLTQTVNHTGPFTVTAGTISRAVQTVADNLLKIEANFFTDGQSIANPFSRDIDRSIIPGESGSTSESTDCFLTCDSSRKYPFRFYIQDKETADNLRITRSGLSFGGSKGDYILLPGVEDKKLKSVFILADTAGMISINSPQGIQLTPNAPTVVDVSSSQAGQACRLEVCENAKIRIRNITLYYDTSI